MTDQTAVGADDWRAAVELVARFEEAVDARDVDAFRAFLTPDGVITGQMTADRDHLDGVVAPDNPGPPLMHLTANHVVEPVAPDRLRVRYQLVVLALAEPSPVVVRAGRITDTLHRTESGWRIQEHHVGGPELAGH